MPLILRPPGERVPLPAQLSALGQSRKRFATAAGVLALIGITTAIVLICTFLDAWLHLSPLIRGMALVATLISAGVLVIRGVSASLRLPTTPLSIALELEDHFPNLNDSLASAVSFLGGADRPEAQGVSNRLAAASIRKAERLTERHNFARLVPTGRFWRAFWGAFVVFGIAVGLGAWDIGRARTALVRLADPFGIHPWPAKTRIEILSPAPLPIRMPKGEPFDLKFVVRGVIPDRAVVSFHLADGRQFEEAYPLAPPPSDAGPAAAAASARGVHMEEGGAVVLARFDTDRLPQNFSFRITANDADTGWQSVMVLPPPRLVALNGRPSPQVHLVPPAYTCLEPVDLPDGVGVIEAPTGSTFTLRAAADTRLRSAALTYLGSRTAVDRAVALAPLGLMNPEAALAATMLASAAGSDIPISLSPDGRILDATFRPCLSGLYAIKLTDESGLSGSRLLEIRLRPDPVPVVTLLRPMPGRDPALLTPSASVTVHVTALHEAYYALRRVFLEYQIGKEGEIHVIPLANLDTISPPHLALAGGTLSAVRLPPMIVERKLTLPLTALRRDDGSPVRDGDLIILRAAADDWDDVSVLKPPGRSKEFEIRIASRAAVEAFLQKELAALRPELMRVKDQQSEARQKAAEVAPRADSTLTADDRDKLLSAEQSQRQLRAKIADQADGLRAKADLLRETARANGLPRSHTSDRVNVVADELDRLANRELAAVEPLLGEARQKAGQPVRPGQEPGVAPLLAKAGRHQKAVEEGLSGLLELLAEWGGPGEVRGEAQALRDGVEKLTNEAESLTNRVPAGKARESLTENQQKELDRPAGKLDHKAEQVGQLLSRAARIADEKEKQAAEAKAESAAKEEAADQLRKKIAGMPPDSQEAKAMRAKTEALADESEDSRRSAANSAAEAKALRAAIAAVGGGQALPDELRKSADAVRNNRAGEAAAAGRSALSKLDKLSAELAEKPEESTPAELAKKKKLGNQLDTLGAEQAELNKKVEAASTIPDKEARTEELQRLGREQEKLRDRALEAVQRLTRERADDAARTARQAADRMESAREDLEQGRAPTEAQAEAVEKLDTARDQVDKDGERAARELSSEKRRKLIDLVKALQSRQQAAAAEADRIQQKVLADKKWERPLLASYGDLEDRERALAVETRTASEREFDGLPVFARVLRDAADAMDKAADKAKDRRQDALDSDPASAFDPLLEKANDAKVRRPMALAARRFDQLLAAIDSADKPRGRPAAPASAPTPPDGDKPPAATGEAKADVVPPEAQLKALRELQADLNQRTAEFAKAHPDVDKLNDDEREELKELEQTQREIAALFEEIAKLFQQQAPNGDLP